MFIVAVLDHMTEQGLVFREARSMEVTGSVGASRSRRAREVAAHDRSADDQLSDEQRHALDVASVAGVAFSARVCAAAADVDQKTLKTCAKNSRAAIA